MAQRTINSPGVEIRESDLSLTAPANIGTSVYVTGFAQQGPMDEVLLISSKQELLQIFGPPTNSPERYFHHTLNELLNSPSTVYAGRLPYGAGNGDGFGSKYSALAYPVRAVTEDTVLGDTISAYDMDLEFNHSFRYEALSGAQFTIATNDGTTSATFGISSNAVVGDTGAEAGTLLGGLSAGPGTPYPDYVITLSDADLNGLATNYSIASSIGYAVQTSGVNITSQGSGLTDPTNAGVRFLLSGDVVPVTYGSVTPSVTPGYTGANDTFTLSAVSDQNVTSTLNMSAATYVLGQPTHLELTENQYLSALEGTAYSWDTTAGGKDSFNVSNGEITSLGGAGVVVLNKSTSTINDKFEGYYVGLADNTNVNPADNFNTVLKAKTINTSSDALSTYVEIPQASLEFNLSANAQTGSTNSVSEVLENLTDYDIGGRKEDDLLQLGVFKLRRSIYANEAFKLDYILEDGIVGSINAFRTQLNPQGGLPIPYFIERQDTNSRNVEIQINENISNRLTGTDALSADGTPVKKIRVLTTQLTTLTDAEQVARSGIPSHLYTPLQAQLGKADNIYPLGAYTNNTVTGKVLGDIPSKLERVLDGVKNNEIYDIDVVVEGGLGTIYSVACAAETDYYDEFAYAGKIATAVDGLRTSNGIGGTAATLRNNYSTIFNKFEQFVSPPYLGGGRGDCIFIADPIRQICVTGNGERRILDNKDRNFQTHVYWPIRHQFENENTSYACTYGNWALVYDSFSGQQVWAPFSGFAGAAMARTDAVEFPWFAPAGFSRGLIPFANDIAINPNQKQRDEFYKANINPVAQFPGQGLVIFGQKTLNKKPSAFDRINVRRLFLALERPTKKVARFFVFEQNSEFTRTRVINTLMPIFERAKNNQGLYDYLIVCDERNNTPAVIDANELVVDIYIKPTRAAEFILVNFYATTTDANFEELIGG